MRTSNEIVDRIKAIKDSDWMATQTGDLVDYLVFDQAKQFLIPEATREDWKQKQPSTEAIQKEMQEYMTFALGKAENHRGLSAGRSIDHYKAWLWLIGDDDMLKYCDDDAYYTNYGVPILNKICEKYGFDKPVEPWFSNMAAGRPCVGDCFEGCGT